MSMRGRRQPKRAALEFIYTGNGSATFDPTLTTSKSTTILWQTSDNQKATTTGTSHAFSYTPASGGPYRCTARVAGGLGLVTALDCNTDRISRISNIEKTNLTTVNVRSNDDLALPLSVFRKCLLITAWTTRVYGPLTDINRAATMIDLKGLTRIYGSLSDLPSTLTTLCDIFGCTGITPGSIGHITGVRDIRLYSMWAAYTAADSVDIVINSMWAARAAYTHASGPSMQIGGTNPDPTGNIVAPVEGADWHEDTPGHWVPRTPGAKIYDLLNDVNSEGFPTWTSIAT